MGKGNETAAIVAVAMGSIVIMVLFDMGWTVAELIEAGLALATSAVIGAAVWTAIGRKRERERREALRRHRRRTR